MVSTRKRLNFKTRDKNLFKSHSEASFDLIESTPIDLTASIDSNPFVELISRLIYLQIITFRLFIKYIFDRNRKRIIFFSSLKKDTRKEKPIYHRSTHLAHEIFNSASTRKNARSQTRQDDRQKIAERLQGIK